MESTDSTAATVSSDVPINGVTTTTTEIEIEEEMDSFPRFDVVSGTAADHFHLNRPPGGKPGGGSSSSAAVSASSRKKIMREWKILEKDLPTSIYVRVYETRIDLMRAAIVGAAGTPYHDGLFFFDICFPPDYPSVPPLVHYRSFGVRINPNLYESGRVCLSLINTWSGKKTERWNSKESTILQVLLSIQALVLNEKPYFNEPGVGVMPARSFWEKKSTAYSENVFILSCKSMIYLLRRPPMGFEALTAAHFRQRARPILSACHAYSSGQARVGYYGVVASVTRPDRPSPASEKFKSLIRELYPVLLSAFRKEGASIGDFSERLENTGADPSGSIAKEKKNAKKKEKKRGVADKIFGKLGKLLGLKKRMNKKKSDAGNRRKGESYSSTQVIPKPPEPVMMTLIGISDSGK